MLLGLIGQGQLKQSCKSEALVANSPTDHIQATELIQAHLPYLYHLTPVHILRSSEELLTAARDSESSLVHRSCPSV